MASTFGGSEELAPNVVNPEEWYPVKPAPDNGALKALDVINTDESKDWVLLRPIDYAGVEIDGKVMCSV